MKEGFLLDTVRFYSLKFLSGKACLEGKRKKPTNGLTLGKNQDVGHLESK